jgi:diamine N-acetyltransferase
MRYLAVGTYVIANFVLEIVVLSLRTWFDFFLTIFHYICPIKYTNMNQLKITQATPQDWETLMYLSKETFFDAFQKESNPEDFAIYTAKAFLPEVIQSELAETSCTFFLATLNDVHCGYLKIRWDRSEQFYPTEPALEIQRIYFKKDYWNQGHGKTLLLFAENYAITHQFKWLWLCVWFKNLNGIRFYEREGYHKFARMNFPFGNSIHHDHVMSKCFLETK